MVNGQSKAPNEVSTPIIPETAVELLCHKFFVGMAFPIPDPLRPGMAKVDPKVATFPCFRAKCNLWNAEAGECWEKTAFKAQALQGQWAFAQRHNVFDNQAG